MDPKKEWQKPELIVLVRSKPEENVLGYCKAGNLSGPVGEKCKKKYAPIPCQAHTHS